VLAAGGNEFGMTAPTPTSMLTDELMAMGEERKQLQAEIERLGPR